MNEGPTMQRIGLGLILAALSAALFTLAFPPYDLWPLVFVGLVPMIVAQHRVMPPRLSGLAAGVGIGGFFWGYFGGMFAGSVWYMRWLPRPVRIWSSATRWRRSRDCATK